MLPTEGGTRRPTKLWVVVVLVIGVLVGLLLSAAPTPARTPSGAGHGPGWAFQLETATDYDVILSTVGIALLVALLVVYARVYADTKAGFILGLVVVLLALLLESVLSSPLVYGAFGSAAGDLGTFLAFADVFKVVAFTLFLYLSLE